MPDTLFSKIIRGEIPAKILYQDEDLVAFADKYPVAPHHILIVPRRPIPTVNDLTDQDAPLIGKMILTARAIAAEQGMTAGYRLVMNCDAAGGQTIDHLHLHLIGGRQMHWPPG
jgi:histidine triad (HIT) family protein